MDNYYKNIKELLINNEITKRVKTYSINKSDLETKYKVGKLLSEAGKHYGEGIIKKYSINLTKDLNIKYDISSLNKMRKFYNLIKKMATLSPNSSYSHYVELLPYNDPNKVRYYIRKIEEQNLSVRQLREKIKSKEYERLPENTKNKLINKESIDIKESIPEPIIIKVNSNIDKENIKEKILQKIIVEDISNFMEQLGNGYSYIKNEFKIKIGNTYNYIDMLLFNIKYNAYVVVELKITELKKNI